VVNDLNFDEDKLKNMEITVNPELENIIPKLSDAKYQVLKTDISLFGLKKSIDVMIVGENKKETGYIAVVVDGHHRYRAMTELKKILSYPENITVLDLISIEDAKEYSFEINWFRRQPNDYPSAKWVKDVYGPKGMTYKEMAKKVSLTEDMINKSAYITKVAKATANKTNAEINQIQEIIKELDLDDKEKIKKVTAVYNQFKIVEEVFNAIEVNEDIDEEFRKALKTEWEVEKYKDKNAVKHLTEEIDLWVAEKAGETYEVTQYDKDVYPLMLKIIKLREKYSGVNAITTAGTQSAIDNAIESVRKFLMNNMNENITDVIEAVRNILIENLEEKREKDLGIIMKQVVDELEVSKTHDYFIGTFVQPKNPKGVA